MTKIDTAMGLSRRSLLASGAALLATPMLSRRAFAAPTELTMLAWYGHAEPDIVAEFEAENNVKFIPKYYTGGDNMLGLISQSPAGMTTSPALSTTAMTLPT